MNKIIKEKELRKIVKDKLNDKLRSIIKEGFRQSHKKSTCMTEDVMNRFYDIKTNGNKPVLVEKITLNRLLNKHGANGMINISANRSDLDRETNDENTKDACFYSISRDIVQMQPKETFKIGEAYINNLSHECSHALGAVGRLDRFTPERMGKPNFQCDEELTAELSAALVCSRWGLEKSIKKDSIPYLKSWLDSLHESPSYIKTVMQDVKKTSSMLIGRFEEVRLELEQEKAEKQEQTEEHSADKTKAEKQNMEAMEQQEIAAKAVPSQKHEVQEEEHVHRGWRM